MLRPGTGRGVDDAGSGFGPPVERTGTFIDFPQSAISAMILGRPALLAVPVIALPAFWKR